MLNRWYRLMGIRIWYSLWLGVASVAACSLGCAALTKSALLGTTPGTEKVPAEYSRLPGKIALVYVWVRPEIRWAYDKMRLDLASYLSEYLEQKVPDVNMVDCLRVESYLEKSSTFDVDPVELGRHFGADVVIHLSVYQFSMRDPGLAHYYRGRMAASVVVHELGEGQTQAERVPLGDVEVVVPEEGPVGFTNVSPTEVRQRTYFAFIEKTGRKFHDYEREIE